MDGSLWCIHSFVAFSSSVLRWASSIFFHLSSASRRDRGSFWCLRLVHSWRPGNSRCSHDGFGPSATKGAEMLLPFVPSGEKPPTPRLGPLASCWKAAHLRLPSSVCATLRIAQENHHVSCSVEPPGPRGYIWQRRPVATHGVFNGPFPRGGYHSWSRVAMRPSPAPRRRRP